MAGMNYWRYCNGMGEDYYGIREIPHVLVEMIQGRHQPYINNYFDGVFNGGGDASGMRLSVYCSDKMAYAHPVIARQQEDIQPYLSGFHANDIYGAVCDCWKVKPVNRAVKQPFYSNTPALLGAGGMDDQCRPVYNDLIHHYLPNSQRILFTERQHAPLLNSYEGDVMIGEFLDHPFVQIVADKPGILAY